MSAPLTVNELRLMLDSLKNDAEALEATVADLEAERAAAQAREARLVGALREARDKFTEYAILHMAKGTAEGNAKADANAEMAAMCANAALTADGAALAAAITALLDSRGNAEDLCRLVGALRAAWRGA